MEPTSAEDYLELLGVFQRHGFAKELGHRSFALFAFFVGLRKPYGGSYRDLATRTGMRWHSTKETLTALADSGFIRVHVDSKGVLHVEVQYPKWLRDKLDSESHGM